MGDGQFSSELAVIAATVPLKPTALIRDEAETSKTSVAISWTAPADDGGSDLIDYTVEIAKRSAAFATASDSVQTTSYKHTENIETGESYKLRVKARNAVGLSEYSDEVTVVAAVRPLVPSAPVTSLKDNNNNVLVSWQVPSDDGGSPVLSYRLLLKQKDGSFSVESTSCDAENSQSITDSRECTVAISLLTAEPFSLEDEDHVHAKVIALNIVGESAASEEGNGAEVILSSPPDKVTGLSISSQDKTSISFSWTEPANGGRPIQGYKIMWDQGSAVASYAQYQDTASTATSLTISEGLTTGETYTFTVLAYNSVDDGQESDPLSIMVATLPSVPLSLQRDEQNTSKQQVSLLWTPPSDNGGTPILNYQIEFDQGLGSDSSFVVAESAHEGTSFSKSEDIVTGTGYRFRLRARNAIGLSPSTDALLIYAAVLPS